MASLLLGDEPFQYSDAFEKSRKASRAALKARMEEIYAEWARPRTPEEQARLDKFWEWINTDRKPLTPGPHPSAEEMIREDRDR
jgi:hypothetical protein